MIKRDFVERIPFYLMTFGATALFAKETDRVSLALRAINYLVCSSAVQALAHLFDEAAKKTNHKGIVILLHKMEVGCRYMHHYLHADWYNRTVGQLFHEIGHVAMVELLCKDTTSTVEIYGGGKSIFGGSGYKYKYEYLSKLGRILGEKNVTLMVTAAGPLVDMIHALSLTFLAHVSQGHAVGEYQARLCRLVFRAVDLSYDSFYLPVLGKTVETDYLIIERMSHIPRYVIAGSFVVLPYLFSKVLKS